MDEQNARLPLRTSADTDGTVQRVLAKLEESGRALDVVAMVANWEAGFRPFITMADALLFQGRLRPVDREIAVLHIASALNLPYEWQEHLPMARDAGVTRAQIAALEARTWPKDGPRELFSEDQHVILELTDQLCRRGRIEPAAWFTACSRLGRDTALEVVMAFAWWGGFVRVIIEALLPHAHRR